ncbi:hypothetical protein M378DRAFT_13083 [Amanita muscaria Koide BX008]|uniref:SH3 domain-containing protein n=1 Tax=Amanita muscaria (strain Koide BX008) TaxID=946122 RepID=A0A0C2X0D6_AMAMK|nr:hypothetical protein M378DRAFT_13083 [Amanita muscaria Koide BX008]
MLGPTADIFARGVLLSDSKNPKFGMFKSDGGSSGRGTVGGGAGGCILARRRGLRLPKANSQHNEPKTRRDKPRTADTPASQPPNKIVLLQDEYITTDLIALLGDAAPARLDLRLSFLALGGCDGEGDDTLWFTVEPTSQGDLDPAVIIPHLEAGSGAKHAAQKGASRPFELIPPVGTNYKTWGRWTLQFCMQHPRHRCLPLSHRRHLQLHAQDLDVWVWVYDSHNTSICPEEPAVPTPPPASSWPPHYRPPQGQLSVPAAEDNETSLVEGEYTEQIENADEGWWHGLGLGGKSGPAIPAAALRPLTPPPAEDRG